MLRPLLLAAAIVLPVPVLAGAEEFQAVRDRQAFLSLVNGRDLSLPLFRIRLSVEPDGRIEGSALGWEITGTWAWKDGYFCREMDWSGKAIPYNCQLVEVRDDRELRFTVDRGEGESARFKLD
ncbi:dihydrodipicolinate reductase [Neotabrizicola shimadae]|uniref:Dihydrodipicolinate reductase n=1 Tax=Neotabrizicola shimadae TaxID=2807096 RepID=A0A8G1EDI1_9RHOB|nr:dihydrodipicolinate reductase [Neotabrizicola shimadae]QYZ69434.1 dihydrodipicolinate reductase [Neotabrizicola shimadae]